MKFIFHHFPHILISIVRLLRPGGARALMVLILIVTASISPLLGNFKVATKIMAITILNSASGMSQGFSWEWRAGGGW